MNNNSIKYSPWIKALCFALSVITFVLFSFNAVFVLRPLEYFSPEEIFSEERERFYDSDNAKAFFNEKVYSLSGFCEMSVEKKRKELDSKKEKEVEAALQDFISQKAGIIHDELVYVATNYEDNYEDGAKFTESYIDSIPDTPEKEQKYPVNPYAPANSRLAQKILNYAEGEELLKYESLVRNEAFDSDFACQFESFGTYYDALSFKASVEEAKKSLEKIVNNYADSMMMSYSANYSDLKSEISEFQNIKYYIKKGDKVITNMTKEEKKAKDISNHDFFFILSDGETEHSGFSELAGRYNNYSTVFKNCSEVKIYMVNEGELTGNDSVTRQYKMYNELNYSIKPYMIKAVAFFIVSVAALIVMLNLSGHKRGIDGITLSFTDKIPGDIHLAAAAALLVFGALGFYELFCETFELENFSVFSDIIKPVILILAAMWMVLIEWITSVVRLAKSEKSYFGNFLTVKIILFVFRLIKKAFKFTVSKIKNIQFRYKPKHFRRKIIIAASVLLVVNAFIPWFFSVLVNDFTPGFFYSVLLAVVGIAAVWFLRKYVVNLDKIIDASQKRESVDFGNEKVPESLSILNNSLKISNEEVSAAVEKAVKNERTKTELITNVSHDLKTPLTSIISYVDLLKSCKINDDDAKKYIGIIDEKSANLKVLIENLIEASKVSAGNVKLNRAAINLKELVIQGLVEYSPEFENRNLDLRFNENCEPVTVFADGQQTYRIIENLLSNAKKYSAPNTRVYALIKEENGFGIFEIKNMSNAPLDISPEELTERFVRGDASRGEEEGNGLGLSIAKELCLIQGGKLEISIDGDLFKATVYLPSDKNSSSAF